MLSTECVAHKSDRVAKPYLTSCTVSGKRRECTDSEPQRRVSEPSQTSLLERGKAHGLLVTVPNLGRGKGKTEELA